MNASPQLFLRLRMLQCFLDHCHKLRNELVQDLKVYATDPTKRRRRFRMLRQLSLYESEIIKKIELLQTDQDSDFLSKHFEFESYAIVRRDA